MSKKGKSFLGFEKTSQKRSDFVKEFKTFDGRVYHYAFDLRGKEC